MKEYHCCIEDDVLNDELCQMKTAKSICNVLQLVVIPREKKSFLRFTVDPLPSAIPKYHGYLVSKNIVSFVSMRLPNHMRNGTRSLRSRYIWSLH